MDWSQLQLPLMQAPMFIASSKSLVLASCRAGVIGAFPSANPRAPETLESWLDEIADARQQATDRGEPFAPFCVNLLASAALDAETRRARITACRKARVPIILTNMGDPRAEVEAAHEWGGIVIHDVTTVRHAEKAIAAGVDGLMLVTAGAGGHAGTLNAFAFLPRVRRMFGGLIMLAGGIADGRGIAAALTLGADLVVMGTRFIATRESGADPRHKAMLVASESEDVLFTDAIAGLPASFLKPSMIAAGLDPDHLPPPSAPHRPDLPPGIKPWKTIWSGGHSTALVDDVPSVADLAARLRDELDHTGAARDWRENLARRTTRTG